MNHLPTRRSTKSIGKLKSVTVVPLVLSFCVVIAAIAVLSLVAVQQSEDSLPQVVLAKSERLEKLLSESDSLQQLLAKVDDIELRNSLMSLQGEIDTTIRGLKTATAKSAGTLPALVAQLESKPELATLNEIERVAKSKQVGLQTRLWWHDRVRANLMIWIGSALALASLLSFLHGRAVVSNIELLAKGATEPDLVKNQTGVDDQELSELRDMLQAFRVRLLTTVQREQLAARYVADALNREAIEREKLDAILTETRARARVLMDEMPVGLILLDADGNISFANRTASRIAGKPVDELTGGQFVNLLSGSQVDSAATFFELFAQQSGYQVGRIAHDSGEAVQVQMWLNELSENNATTYLLVLIDYTDEQKYKERQRRLVAMVAHDIATPISTVQAILDMAKDGLFGELMPLMQTEAYARARECGEMLRHFKNIVRFERLASNFATKVGAQLSLDNLTSEAINAVQSTIDEKEVEVKTKIPGGIAVLGSADELALLGAKLLQLVVDRCEENGIIEIYGTKEQIYVSWELLVVDDFKILEQLQPYMEQPDRWDFSGGSKVDMLDVLLWNLLLQQCGARLSFGKAEKGAILTLRLPTAESSERVAAESFSNSAINSAGDSAGDSVGDSASNSALPDAQRPRAR